MHRTANSLVPEREKITVMVHSRCRAALYIVALAYCSNLVASNAPEPEPWVGPLGQVVSTCKANHSVGLEFDFEQPRVDAEVNVNAQCFSFGSSGSPFGTEHRERELSAMASFAAPAKPGHPNYVRGFDYGRENFSHAETYYPAIRYNMSPTNTRIGGELSPDYQRDFQVVFTLQGDITPGEIRRLWVPTTHRRTQDLNGGSYVARTTEAKRPARIVVSFTVRLTLRTSGSCTGSGSSARNSWNRTP